MPDRPPQKTPSRWIAVVALLLGAACSFSLMVYVGGGWTKGASGYAAWALMPYVLSTVILVALRYFYLQSRVERALVWIIAFAALAGPLLCVAIMFIHVDAQGAIAILMVPLIHTGLLFASLAGAAWHWRTRRSKRLTRHDDSVSPQTVIAPASGTRLGRAVFSIFKILLVAVLSGYLLISWLQSSDAKTIDTAREVDFYIRQYCTANSRLPPSAQLHERFPGLSTDIGWFYFTDDKTWLKVQYPVKWQNRLAIGKKQLSEFTATAYSYVMEYRCEHEK